MPRLRGSARNSQPDYAGSDDKDLHPAPTLSRTRPLKCHVHASRIEMAGKSPAIDDNVAAETLLRGDSHFRRGGKHVGIDVFLVNRKVLLEHVHELARGDV